MAKCGRIFHDYTPVCAIGASAGGVSALREFFAQIGDDLGVAFVVIMHLAPDHPGVLAEILAGSTTMPVRPVADSPRLMPNCVYVIPPDRELVIKGDHITARPFSEARDSRAPIDHVFRTVAAARGDGVVVILTGSGSDGAAGVRAVKEAGGVVFIQDPDEAEFPAMPRSALATGDADFVLPIRNMGERIAEVVRNRAASPMLGGEEAENHLRDILGLLQARTGHSFSRHKRATVLRRIRRRMRVTRCAGLDAYTHHLRESPEEAQKLLEDLLISVTTFFRNPDAFEALETEAIRPIFDQMEDGQGIRVWVAGCATGEEAYSLAILLLEEATRRSASVPIQIFATDLDEGALATAREGLYPASIEADVSEDRLRRFFAKEGAHYRVTKEIRNLVLFASHSALKDPPFMRLQLITCRNLLVDLDRDLQREVCGLFHYGLVPNGCLFLGSTETAEVVTELYSAVNHDACLYRALPQNRRRLPPLPATEVRVMTAHRPPRSPVGPRVGNETAIAQMHVSALERAAPPSVLVDRDRRILHLSPTAGRFLLPSGGTFTVDLLPLVRPELRIDLHIALRRALEQGEATLTPPTIVAFYGTSHRILMQVTPTQPSESTTRQALVFFLDGGQIDAEPSSDASRTTAERLKTSHDEYELAIQELRAANEELHSINEEYCATSEELETSKEELQSMNAELQTVNEELQRKLEVIASAHSDLRNMVTSTEVGTLFLDAELRIRMLTPTVARVFNITDADVGRAITTFTHRLDYDGLNADARRVLRDLCPIEREVPTIDGRWLMMRLRPYHTIDDRFDGVVVTFVDVTERRQTTARLEASEEKYRSLFQSMTEGLVLARIIWDEAGQPVDAVYSEANPAAIRTVKAEFLGRRLRDVFPDLEPHWWEIPARVLRSGEPERHELFAAPLEQWFEVYIWKVTRDDDRVAVLFRDVTRERRQRDESAAREKAEAANRKLSSFLASVSHDLRQPVMAANLFVGLLKMQPLRDKERDLLDPLADSLASLTGMLTGLLEVARLDAGVFQQKIRDFDLDEVLGRLLSEFQGQARETELFLEVPHTGVAVRADPLLVELVLRNLLSNAVKFTETGGIRVEVAVEGEAVRLSVVDTGVGIPAEKIEHIFDEYVQLGKTARDHSRGFGLGLSTVRRVAALLGTAVEVRSDVGHGSTFSLSLPLAGTDQAQPEDNLDPSKSGSPKGDARVALNGATVLVVDDEALVLKALTLSLQSHGATVLAAHSLREAVTLLERSSPAPDAIVADYTLSHGERGTEAIAAASARGVAAAVLITGDTAPERMAEAQGSGYRLLNKPVDSIRLVELLAEMLARH
ncbi:chemotaxis protein CheB [Azospirillum canadense]|uniref:chemotaxis protein CheB n=1 Tax=Azospirillum canadense TaxID=403962 RepID=UPI002227E2A7|nr:chemotaxis protein CheB [Azospirillum canadense]MCW2239156.1 two-component system CheB/CheR fusion protein [Azospirillum canadense]